MIIIFSFQIFNISSSFFLLWYWKFDKLFSEIWAKLFEFAKGKPIFLVEKMTKFVGGEKKQRKTNWNFDFPFTISDNDNNDIITLTKLTNINSAFF